MSEFSRETFPVLMADFMAQHGLSHRLIANAIRCSEATLTRILNKSTLASDEMLRQGAILVELGFDRYCRLIDAEREKLSATLSVVGGGAIGFGSVTAAVGTMGSVAGLSAAGISSGLAAMGAIVGGGMAVGVAVAAAIPIIAGGIGYGIIRTVKHFVSEAQLATLKFDSKWELPKDTY